MVKKIIPFKVAIKSTAPTRNFERPKVYTNDLNSVEFQFTVTDCTDAELTNSTATTMLYMTDKSFFQNPTTDVDRVANVYSYTLKENEGNHGGLAEIQLVIIIDGVEFASQLYEFEIINGLETKVAQEVMIYDWTTLTRDARAYIDQFVADEVFRDAQFENAQFDRNVAFVGSQDARALAFGTEQTNRGTAFTAEQNERTTAFNESESGRTTAETGRVTAESNRVTAETGRTTAESNRVTAESNRVTAESGRVTAESGRVTAESARVTAETIRAAAFTAFDTRLTAEETATAANKISAVKGKTFADVDSRIEDVEFDTTMMATNGIVNGDFSNGTTGWGLGGSNFTVFGGEASVKSIVDYNGRIFQTVSLGAGLYYLFANIKSASPNVGIGFNGYSTRVASHPGTNTYVRISTIVKATADSNTIFLVDKSSLVDTTTFYIKHAGAINLTAAFGAGNEPTAEQMDAILAKFPNSWFDGTKNLFRASATLAKQIAIDARTEFEAKNDLANGDFSNGTTVWAAAGSTIAVANNELAVTQSVDWNSRAITTPAFVTSGTNMFYIAANVKATVNTVGINLDSYAVGLKYHSGSGAYERLSAVVTNSNPSHNLYLVDKGTLAVPPRTSYVKNAIVINLTAAFGAGKEPTLAEMDRLMARFPNSWFDGVKPIQTIETLYQEKANKVQEAWITPTLLNSWVAYDGVSTPRYRKDEFGIVHVQGRVKSGTVGVNVFLLPVGYRPSMLYRIPINQNGLFGSVTINVDGSLYVDSGANGSAFMDFCFSTI